MNDREKAELTEDYLDRLSQSLRDVPTSSRQELVEDVRRHIDEAWAESPDHSRVSLLNILGRLGEPEDLAMEVREPLTPGSEAKRNLNPPPRPTRRRGTTWSMMLVLLLVLCSLSVIWIILVRPVSSSEQVPLAQVVADAKAGRIELIQADQGNPEIVVKYDDGRVVRSRTPNQVNVVAFLQDNGVDVTSGKPQIIIQASSSWSEWLAGVIFFLPLLLLASIPVLGIVLVMRLLVRQST